MKLWYRRLLLSGWANNVVHRAGFSLSLYSSDFNHINRMKRCLQLNNIDLDELSSRSHYTWKSLKSQRHGKVTIYTYTLTSVTAATAMTKRTYNITEYDVIKLKRCRANTCQNFCSIDEKKCDCVFLSIGKQWPIFHSNNNRTKNQLHEKKRIT